MHQFLSLFSTFYILVLTLQAWYPFFPAQTQLTHMITVKGCKKVMLTFFIHTDAAEKCTK